MDLLAKSHSGRNTLYYQVYVEAAKAHKFIPAKICTKR
jgi:hypothetical protein